MRNQDKPTLKVKELRNVPGIPDTTREGVTKLVAATLWADERTADGTYFVIILNSSRASQLLMTKG